MNTFIKWKGSTYDWHKQDLKEQITFLEMFLFTTHHHGYLRKELWYTSSLLWGGACILYRTICLLVPFLFVNQPIVERCLIKPPNKAIDKGWERERGKHEEIAQMPMDLTLSMNENGENKSSQWQNTGQWIWLFILLRTGNNHRLDCTLIHGMWPMVWLDD